MSIYPQSVSSTSALPPVKPSLLQQGGTAIFDLLDAPGNFTRSLLAGDPLNALKQVGGFIPGVDSRRVPGSEVTGWSDDEAFWTNLAVEIFADPLLLVNEIGAATKASKALKGVASAKRELQAVRDILYAKRGGKLLEADKAVIKGLEEVFESRKTAYKALKEPGKKLHELDKGRHAVTLGVPFGKKFGIGELNIGRMPSGPFFTPPKTIQHNRMIKRKLKDLEKIERKLGRSVSPIIPIVKEYSDSPNFGKVVDIPLLQDGKEIGIITGRRLSNNRINVERFIIEEPTRISKATVEQLERDIQSKAGQLVRRKRYNVGKNAKGAEIPIDFKVNAIEELWEKGGELITKLDTPLSKTHEAKLLADKTALESSIEISQRFGNRWVEGAIGIKGTKSFNKSVIGRALAGLDKRFRFAARNPQIEAIKDAYRTETAKEIAEDLNITQVRMADLVETIGKIKNESKIETEKRLVSLGENPLIGSPEAIAPKAVYKEEAQALKQEYGKKWEELNKQWERAAKKNDRGKLTELSNKAEKLQQSMSVKTDKLKTKLERARLDRAKFEEQVGKLIPEEEQFIDLYIRSMDKWIPLAKDLGVDVEFLQSSKGLTKYVPRLLTKEAKELKRLDKEKYTRALNEFSIRFSGSHRRELFPELSINAVNDYLKTELGIGYDFFRTDIADLLIERRAEMHKVLNKAAAINVFTDAFGTTKALAGHKPWKAEKLFKRFGLRTEKAPKLWLPKDAVNDLDRIKDFFGEMDDLKGIKAHIFAGINGINTVFQGALTSLFPAFHTRNFVNNMAMNWMAGVKSRYMVDAHRLQRMAAKGELAGKDLALWIELNRVGAVKAGQFEVYKRFVEQAPGSWKKWLNTYNDALERPGSSIMNLGRKMIGKPAKEFRREQWNPLIGRAFGHYVEENARIAHYLSKRADGNTAFEAMRSMNKWLFDYDKLTDFEKQNLRPLFLFYTWSRNNIPLMIKTSFTNPRFGAIYTKLTGLGDEELPQYLNRGFAFKAPPGLGPNEYIGSLGLGIEDLNIFNVGAADPASPQVMGVPIASPDQIRRLALNIATRLSPALKMPAEGIVGKDFFTGRELSESTFGEWASRNLPTSRVTNTAGKLFDPERTWASTLVDLMTGIRTYHVSPESLAIDTAKRRAIGSGYFKRRQDVSLQRKYKDDPTAKKLQKELSRVIRENRNRK